jgi:FAD/FMN-containing dehydrogenase
VVVLERGALPEAVDAWGEPGAAIDVMRAIKMEFDAGRLLNPGKFVGGL